MSDQKQGLDSFIEMKLSKGEAIDLLIVELKDEIAKSVRDLEHQIKEISKTFTFKDVAAVVSENFPVSLSFGYKDDGTVSIQLGDRDYGNGLSLKPSKLPADVQERLKQRGELTREKQRLEHMLHRLEDKKGDARSVIMRQMLESTTSGRRFLSLIQDLRLQVKPKLQLAAKNAVA
jgi:hypothetical protein